MNKKTILIILSFPLSLFVLLYLMAGYSTLPVFMAYGVFIYLLYYMKEWLPNDKVMNIWVKIAFLIAFSTSFFLGWGLWFLEKYLSLFSFPREISYVIELSLLIIFYFPLGYYAWFRKKEIGWIKLYSKLNLN